MEEYETTAYIRVGIVGTSDEGLITFSFKWNPRMHVSELEDVLNQQMVEVAPGFAQELGRLVSEHIRETLDNRDENNPE